MWLYIPSSCLQESGCSERGQEPHSSILESNCEPFATWSGKPLLLRSLSRLWKRESLIQRLSGLTLPLSEASSSVERWIASLPGSHARTSLLPVSAQALMESAPDFSFTSSTSPRIAMRGSSFWRTSVASLLPPPPLWIKLPPPTLLESATDHQKTIHTEKMALYLKEQPPGSWESWPIAGGVRNGSLYQRPTWAPATGVNDGFVSRGGNWGAPTAHDARRPGADVHSTQGANLNRQAALWMTPSVSNSQGNEYTRDRGQKGQERLTLTGQAAQWPTPAARDSKGANSADHALVTGGGRKHMDQLANFVEHSPSSPLAQKTPSGETSSSNSPGSRPRLNPAFDCWLMGWPCWWTNPGVTRSAKSAMELYRSRLQQQLSLLCAEQES